MHESFLIVVLQNKRNRGALKGKMSTCLWSMPREESDCEKVFKRFGSWNTKLSRLEIGSFT
jgi:hypothetical protein